MAVPKIERLLDLVAALLHTERPLTAEQIHERIPGYPPDKDSFKRAFERDKKDLRAEGVPLRIETVPGSTPPQEGYRIHPDEYYLRDPGLDADELAAIHLAASAVRLEGASAAAGLRKLGAPLRGDTASTIATLPTAPHLGTAFDAVASGRRLTFRYGGKDRTVDPFRLQHQRGRWYLQGHDAGAGEARSFRLDRVGGEMVAGAPGTAEVDLDPAENPLQLDGWALGDDEPVEARVRIANPQARVAVAQVGPDVPAEWGEDGSVVLSLPVRRTEGFISFVLGFLDDAEVLGPAELRDELVDWLRTVADQGAAG
ncbi:MAG TPA: WYL domain-containing protein [Acidimicrobiales bacterium]